MNTGFDSPHSLGRRHIGYRYPDDLAARLLQTEDLIHRGCHIIGAGIGHGLNGDRSAAAHRDAAHKNLSGHWYTSR